MTDEYGNASRSAVRAPGAVGAADAAGAALPPAAIPDGPAGPVSRTTLRARLAQLKPRPLKVQAMAARRT